MRKIVGEDLPDPSPYLGPETKAPRPVLEVALAKSPEQRYPTAGAFAADLRAVLGGEAVSERAGRAVSRRRARGQVPGRTVPRRCRRGVREPAVEAWVGHYAYAARAAADAAAERYRAGRPLSPDDGMRV